MKSKREAIEYFVDASGEVVTTIIKSPIIPEQEYRESKIGDIVFASSVKEIGSKAFYKCLGIQNVDFNKGLRVIDDYAFFLCENLTNADLPSTLVRIGDYAFYNCKLQEINIGGKVKSIGKEAFAENHMLTKVYINKGVEKIDKEAFRGCYNLSDIYIPSSVKTIRAGAFENTDIKEINLPKITEIEHDLFKKSKLQKIIIPDGVVEIGSGAFEESKLSLIEMPYELIKIGDGAFARCANLQEIDIPEAVSHIGRGAFVGCRGLEYVKLPVSLKEVSANLFQECKRLEHITLPNSIRKIGNSAFENTGLREVVVPYRVQEIGDSAFSKCEYLERVRLPEGLESIGAYAFEDCENLQGIALPDTITKIGAYAFKNCDEIRLITIPDGVEVLSSSLFSFCESLIDVALPKNLIKIDESAFSGCSKLEEINIPEKVKFIEKDAFEGCSSLKNVIIPDSVEYIGEEAFKDCKKLESIVLPKGLVGLSREVFDGCIKLKKVSLPNTLTTIGFESFKNTGLEWIELDDNITFIDAGAFENSCQLVDVKLPKNLTTINETTFSGCILLANINIPDGVKIINDEAFMNCMSLSDVVFPKDLDFIGKRAFKGCENLKEVKLPNGAKVVSEEAFMGCSKLEKVELPDSVEYVGFDAFNGCSSLKEITFNSGLLQECLFNIGENIEVVKINENCRCNLKNLYPFEYITKIGNYFRLTVDPINESSESILDINEKLSLGVLMSCWDNRDKLFRELRSKNAENIIELYNYLYKEFAYRENTNQKFKEFFDNKQLKFFNQLCMNYPKFNNASFYKLFYNLGGFLKPFVETRKNSSGQEIKKTMDYGQIVAELFKDKLLPNDFFRENIEFICNKMVLEGFKKDFTRFMIDRKNIEDMITEESLKYGFIADCYNFIENIQRTNTSNKGRQRTLQPTMQKFKDYFREVKYKGITEETEHIADVIAPFYPAQSAFDLAVEIDNERKEKNVPDRILKVHLREKMMLNNIEKYSEKIKNLYADSLKTLINVAENNFTFDWLDKNDPENFLLGKVTSSCAHLEGAGLGIMRASIIHPDVQNLVIRNKKGEIVAKATLFINRKQGYGLVNTFEVENIFTNKEKLAIYRKFKLAIGAFAERYNKENKDNPIKIINVGMSMNKLEDEVKANDKEATRILTQINYQDYGNNHYNYNGDSNSGQYTVWEKDDEEHNL